MSESKEEPPKVEAVVPAMEVKVVENKADEPTALEAHMGYFANPKTGKIEYTYAYNKFRALGNTKMESTKQAMGTLTLAAGIVKCPFKSFTPKDGLVLKHPCDSRIYDPSGNVNAEAFNKLVQFKNETGAKNYISKTTLFEFMNQFYDEDKNVKRHSFWKNLSEGEWGNLFKLATNHWEKTATGYEPCITFDLLKQFFEDTPAVFKLVEDKKLPVSKPVV
ncbi:MAG: hypothetical protein Edafosvirus62_2 [Edafosvirus sp.]|uniref:Uncharacterized protein n=1 Tax=Edafosvirus sp. TaxID=2487765 RepID=A0A3G4ZVQ5_9VIRU|nr:MAG: hypothetical protein Edafosvirus62_2 [Edafosvirus sp.]